MIRRHRKVAFIAFMVGILLGISVMVAFAAKATSTWVYYGPILGYSYQNQATVSNDHELWFSTYVRTQNSSSVPTGYMGALTRLYKSDVLVASEGWAYNSGPCSGYTLVGSGYGHGSGIYYSKGKTRAYNGNGYNTFDTNQSPNINH